MFNSSDDRKIQAITKRLKELNEQMMQTVFLLESAKLMWRCAVHTGNGVEEETYRNRVLELTSLWMDFEARGMREQALIRQLQ